MCPRGISSVPATTRATAARREVGVILAAFLRASSATGDM